MEQAAQAYPNVEMDIYTGDLEDGQAIVQQMPPTPTTASSPAAAPPPLIRQVTDLPVVDIHISVYDVLRTMKLAENYSSLYAIVGFPLHHRAGPHPVQSAGLQPRHPHREQRC